MIATEPLRGRFAYLDHPWLLSLPGIEQIRLFMRRQLPHPPVAHLTGIRPTDVGIGTTVYIMPSSPHWQTGVGTFPGGVVPFVADAALSSAVFTVLPPGVALATSQLSVDFLRPTGVEGRSVIARGHLVQAGRAQGLAEGTIEDGDGRVLARATTRVVLAPLPFEPPPAPEPLPEPEEFDTSEDLYRRPAGGGLLAADAIRGMTGTEVLVSVREGRLPRSPLSDFLDIETTEIGEGSVTVSLPASPWLCSAVGSFYGGSLALLADHAMGGALLTTLDPDTVYGTLDLKVNFLRPVAAADGRPLQARGSVLHRGRTVAVTTAEITDADGRRVAVATSSAMLFPGKPWVSGHQPTTLDQGSSEAD